ncbi:hypothetical protein ACHAW5_010629 [Stephanodiscus triporus]|uniref:Methyltransferase small domain-containing protein n=1 Tax=Stephanodiscus triporus TaxID=2934178 RepID=A0ABD3NU95_9STRA
MLEVGIGTGILSMIMLRRGVVDRVVGTDINPRAVACAMDNARQFDLDDQMDIVLADLFPPDYRQSSSTTTIEGGKGFDVVLFNPPWMPGDAPTMFDSAVHDPDRMLLRRFVSQAHRYVNRNGHVYIILSNLGALLGLFEEQDLHAMFEEGNLELVEVYETKSKGSRAAGNPEDDSWHITDGITNARAREVISLYKLSVKKR